MMAGSFDWRELPANLPVPEDDGACDHLTGMRLPSVPLHATDGRTVNLADLRGWTVVYCYPRTGRPDEPSPDGWDAIPGARGCTPQSCAFRDHYAQLRGRGAEVFGISTQDTEYQREVAERLQLPFPLLSDVDLRFTHALRLPTFTVAGMTLLKRVTLLVRDARIEHVWYPVFPPDANAGEVVRWLSQQAPA
jgi:peroxiredoxin